MGRIRVCGARCHNAKGTRCQCWCSGAFHGSAGATNRLALTQGADQLLDQAGFQKGETAYVEQKTLPMEVATVGSN